MLTALAFLAQAVVLAWVAPIPGFTGTLLLSAALAAFVLDRLWWMRHLWNPHLDMVLIMLGWGGLGMLLGPLAVGAPLCHSAPAAMWTGMLAASAWPSYRYARCLQSAYQEGRLSLTLAADLAGMALGMYAGALPPTVLRLNLPEAAWLLHGGMLLGMSLGMGGAMLALNRVLRPQVPANS